MEEGMGKRITMMALERKLLDEKEGEAYRKQLLDKILQKRGELSNLMSSGLSPEEYKAWNAFKQALDSALEVVGCYR
ncbi:MAG: EscE/YscE/SsaE family type III secretion system needle protein co-chaperone [Puniceicoccales bacterium]|jgi:type III secretion system YseE family protein|nr:EscE/YscE/SsaE family type III secretion system needle protein co-chaperone [Puniceicoccales bacterium]